MATSRPALHAVPALFSRRSARHARPVVFPRAVGIAGLATATTVAFTPAASADPSPSIGDVAQQVTSLDAQADALDEQFLQAQESVAKAQQRADAAQQRLVADQAQLAAVRSRIAGVAAAAYRHGADDQLVSLVNNGGPDAYLDRASTLDRLAQSQAEVLAQIATAKSRAAGDKAAADRELAALNAAHQQLADRQSQLERTLEAQKSLLANLDQQEQQRVQAARDAAARADAAKTAAAVAPARASRGVARTAAAPAPAPAAAPTYTGPASGRAAAAVQEAYRQLGKPYQYGGSGPNSFDCSGLTSWVWRVAGVSLPHNAQGQYNGTRRVAQSDIQPGDLVYYGGSTGSITHVGIYIGNGSMISAPHTGDVVKIQPAFRSDFVGATRP